MSQWTRAPIEYPISEETAHAQVAQLVELYDLDVSEGKEGEPNPIPDVLDELAVYIRRGLVEVAPDCVVTQHLQDPPGQVRDISYGKVLGKHVIASDGLGRDNYRSRIFNFLGSVSGLGSAAYNAMSKRDVDVAWALGTIFLA